MKKITTLAMMPLFALASCWQDATNVESASWTTNQSAVEWTQTSTSTTLNSNISSSVATTWKVDKTFEETYALPNWSTASVKWFLTINDWKVESIAFDWLDLSNDKNPVVTFAKWISSKIVGQSVKGLQVDTISGASLTTEAFNKFLNTINK